MLAAGAEIGQGKVLDSFHISGCGNGLINWFTSAVHFCHGNGKSDHEILIPRAAPHNDDPKGIEELSPGLPDSERATPGGQSIQPITFARSAASKASISHLLILSTTDHVTNESQGRVKCIRLTGHIR